MLDRDYRLSVRNELRNGELADIGLTEVDELQHIFEYYCNLGERTHDQTLMTNSKWIKFVREQGFLEAPCGAGSTGVTLVDLDLIFVDIAKNSKRPQAVKCTIATKLKLGYPDFLDCLCELAHKRYPELPLREAGLQELILNDVLDLESSMTDFQEEGLEE